MTVDGVVESAGCGVAELGLGTERADFEGSRLGIDCEEIVPKVGCRMLPVAGWSTLLGTASGLVGRSGAAPSAPEAVVVDATDTDSSSNRRRLERCDRADGD